MSKHQSLLTPSPVHCWGPCKQHVCEHSQSSGGPGLSFLWTEYVGEEQLDLIVDIHLTA